MLYCYNCTARKQFQLRTAEIMSLGFVSLCAGLFWPKLILEQTLFQQMNDTESCPWAGNSLPRPVNTQPNFTFQCATEKADKNVKPQTEFWKHKWLRMILNIKLKVYLETHSASLSPPPPLVYFCLCKNGELISTRSNSVGFHIYGSSFSCKTLTLISSQVLWTPTVWPNERTS